MDPTSRRRRALALLVVAVLALAACGGDDDRAAEGPAASTPAAFTGSDEAFYEVPDPLPPGEPGELIRVQELPPPPDEPGVRNVRVMYHSRDAQDRDRAVTGVVTIPAGPAPEGGWPVVSWAHGTTGLAAPCAPSRAGGVAPAFGVEGVRVATDYVGLGPVGERHPYLSGPSEANSVIDAVRAARALPGSGASSRWVAVGHSQGGHAALFTSELAAAHAPELDLLGTAVVAPAAALTETFGPADRIVPHMVGVMALYGLAADHPELDPHDYVSDEVVAVEGVIDEGCSDAVVAAMAPIPLDTFYDRDPLEVEPARSIVLANDPGGAAATSPILLVHGTADTWVVPARVDHLFDRLCSVGQVTERLEVAEAGHDTVVPMAAEDIGAWFAARIADEPPADDCS